MDATENKWARRDRKADRRHAPRADRLGFLLAMQQRRRTADAATLARVAARTGAAR